MKTQETILKNLIAYALGKSDYPTDEPIPKYPFGSCQYEPSYNYYLAITDLIKTKGELATIALFKGYLSPIILPPNKMTVDELKEKLIDDMRDTIRCDNNSHPDDDEEYIMHIPDTIEEYYEETKNQCWDLWSAAQSPIPVPLDSNFPEGTFDNEDDRRDFDSELGGGESFNTGWTIAWTVRIFGTSLETFTGFDT